MRIIINLVRTQSSGLGWILLTICFSIPWLIPIHSDPWATFYSEIIAGIAIIPLAVWTFISSPTRVELDPLAIGFAAVAFIPLIQAFAGLYLFPGEAPIISIYLIGVSLTIVVARRCEKIATGRLPDTLFAALFIASIISTALALAQWLQLDWGVLMAPMPDGGRTLANVGQPNELSTLLVWGLIGLWWAYLQKRISGAISIGAAGFLLIGIVSTQSRTGYLAVAVLFVVSQVAKTLNKTIKHRLGFVILGVWFLVLIFFWTSLTHVVEGSALRDLSDQLSGGQRPAIWKMMLAGILQHPWSGYGWNQGRLVQLTQLPNYAYLKVGVAHAHNFILDLLVWNGIPVGLLIVTLLGYWFWRLLKNINTDKELLLVSAVFTFSLHAMLELPHCKSFFLVPMALMVGILNIQIKIPPFYLLSRTFSLLATTVMAALLFISWTDYQKIERDLISYRMRMARIAGAMHPIAPDIYILTALQNTLVNFRIDPIRKMPQENLSRLKITSMRYPTESALIRYAKAAALNEHGDEATKALSQLCSLFSSAQCSAARDTWSEFASEYNDIPRALFPNKFLQ